MISTRLLSVTPTTDGEHWDLNGRMEWDIIHTDAYAQDPLPFQRAAQISPRNSPPYPWRPGVGVFGSGDALFPGGKSFDLFVDTNAYPATLTIRGAQPVNVAATVQPPIVPLQATTASTGGSIAPGTYFIGVSCNGVIGPVSNYFVRATVPTGTSTNTITVSGINWQNHAAETSPAAFIGDSSMTMRLAASGSYSNGSTDANGNPTSITFTAITPDGLGLPDQNARAVYIEETVIWHGGVWGDTVRSVSGGTALTMGPPSSFGTNQWAGYVLSLYYRPGVSIQPGLNIVVSSNTGTTLTMASAGFQAGDVVVMRQKCGHISANTFGDDNWINAYSSGMTVNGETGRLALVIAGTGAYQPPVPIASNTSKIFTLTQNWYVQPDSASIIIVVDATVAYAYQTQTFANPSSTAEIVIAQVPSDTRWSQQLLLRAYMVDGAGNSWSAWYQPFREVYVPPPSTPQITVTSTPYYIPASDAVITFASGSSVAYLPPSAAVARATIWLINATGSNITVNPSGADTTEGASSLTLYPGQRFQVIPSS